MKRKKMYALVPHGKRNPEYNDHEGLGLFFTRSEAEYGHSDWDNKIVPVYVTIERVRPAFAKAKAEEA